MKFYTLLLFLLLSGTIMYAGETKTITVSEGKSYTNEVFYNLSDDSMTEAYLRSWDIAILVPGQNASLLINSGAGCRLWEVLGKTVDDYGTPINVDSIATDTTHFKEWFNSQDTWTIGAFNCGLDGFAADGDFGWGTYNMSTHAISGVKLFVVLDLGGNYHQIRIEDLLSGDFYFSYSDIDGTNSVAVELNKKSFAGKTFGYYSLLNQTQVDNDPGSWGLLFGKYMGMVDDGSGNLVPYNVNGVRHNYGYSAVELKGVDPSNVSTPTSEQFSTSITTIGYQWKTLNSNYEWEIPTDQCYFVLTDDGLIYKLVFTAFSGSSTGEATFEKTLIDGNSVTDNNGNKTGFFAITPNVIEPNGSFAISYGLNSNNSFMDLSIYNMNSDKVYSANLPSSSFNAVSIEPNIPTGMYIVVLNIDGKTYSQKLIVK